MTELITSLFEFLKAHDILAYAVLFFGSYFETLIGPGFIIHGEIFFLAGSIAAGLGYLNVWLVFLFCVLGGIAGDHSSYWIGRKYGQKISARFFKKENKYLSLKNFQKAKKFFKGHGEKSLFYARLLGPISWITPFLAGIFHTKYFRFTKYNALGVCIGVGQFVAMGYLIGFAYLKIFSFIEKYFLLILSLIIIAVLIGNYLTRKTRFFKKAREKFTKVFIKHGILIVIGYIVCYITLLYVLISV